MAMAHDLPPCENPVKIGEKWRKKYSNWTTEDDELPWSKIYFLCFSHI